MVIQEKVVAGLYIERDNAKLMTMLATPIAQYSEPDERGHHSWKLSYLAHEHIGWDRHKKQNALEGVRYLLSLAAHKTSGVESLGVASYGPFKSLNYFSSNFGLIHPETAHKPLNGLHIGQEIKRAFGRAWIDANRVTIRTDAEACALGEAISRQVENDESTDKRKILAFLICGEGIGLGLVKGRKIISPALHAEVGLLPANIRRHDPLKIKKKFRAYGASIAEMCSDQAMAERWMIMKDKSSCKLEDMINEKSCEFWRYRAYYLAQACLACTAVIPPHSIVIGTRFAPTDDLGKWSYRYLDAVLKGRRNNEQPVFEYSELNDNNFISYSRPFEGFPNELKHSISTTGVVGACHVAAAATTFDSMGHFMSLPSKTEKGRRNDR